MALVAENTKLKERVANLVSENENLQRMQRKNRTENHDQHILQKRFIPVVNQSKSYMRCENLRTDVKNDEYKYYTGFTVKTFNVIFEFLAALNSKKINSLSPCYLTLKNQMLLVLVKLRQDFDFKHMSRLFGLSPQDCSTVFNNWINFMYNRFNNELMWPDRNVIIEKMPKKYREEFPNTIVIIDGAEIKIQKQSSLTVQSRLHSDCKSGTSLKGLIGVDPRGSIIFVSMLFSGDISDEDITAQSGFYNILKDMKKAGKIHEGDGVMAGKGFRIKTEIEQIGLKSNIPPAVPESDEVGVADVNMTEKMAVHSVHVERAVARVKKFKILDERADHCLFSSIDQIWSVCCFLTNFMPVLIPD